MNKLIVWTALSLASVLPWQVQAASEALNYNLVDFNESASVRVPNDTMNVLLEIRETGTSRQTVSNTVTRRLNAVLARAKAAGSVFEVESGNRSAYPQYGERNSIKNAIVGWTDIAQIRISSQNFDALSKLVADSQTEAAVQNLSFSVSPKKREDAVNQASDIALKTFQQRAKHMSQTLGFSGYKIVRIQFNQSFNNADNEYAPMVRMAAMAQPMAAKVAEVAQSSPGVQEIRQTIHVSVQLQ